MRPSQRREGGAALVEFALVVPLLSLFLFGIVQFGIAYDMKQSINSAAREGARMAAIPDEDNITFSAIESRVGDSFDSIGSGEVDEVEVVVVDAAAPNNPRKTCTATDATPPVDSCATTEPAAAPASVSPCTDQEGQTVVVTATRRHDITIPFFGVMNLELTGRGEFRCEVDA